ncbi:F0F1 ATP synthase subunit B [Cryobacterium sp. TMT2-17-1]|uniref:ATP synthase subunit b n=1 Tax=Cryobacterium sandaracinum TaxID=1259247 RepID=A0ABY2JE40_9MICO|nr:MULTISPECIES: F0F1 ATP synthase subunit B [Cryobacterium]TFB61334.1 F0F1 ATP synthase subunit B [Cryobacterium sp. Sr3]TFC37276.1 F0F1 ATP synthase subunit B [Cryobacterium sp. TMT2-14]TFC53646.1 F0F1 ATP synthase subunit B [Cryobacterium sp. TMT2-17-1]TFC70451.1 F0F1 ATP synthase subunit B [Cryobacterium sp. TMT2-4]TFD02613.1 F0F1 ATP synthase subunit B [Cryobacterium sandaracinum]
MPELVLAAEAETNPFLPAIYDITWSAVVFLVVMVFFVRFAIPRFRQILDDRAEAIEGNIAKADDAQRKAEAALEQYTTQLAEARAEAGRIRDAARVDGQTIVNELKEQAVIAAARVTATAKAQIVAERQAAVISLRSEVGTLAIDLASGVIGESLTNDEKASGIVDRFLADLEASEKVVR